MATVVFQSTEEYRQVEQIRLDSLKTAAERNKLGQFATPNCLAMSLARYAHTAMGDEPIRFLDPAIGTGSFFSAVIQSFPPQTIKAAQGVEIDPLFATAAIDLWGGRGLQVAVGDFTKQAVPEQRFSLIIANPPYVRHHHLPAADKQRLRARLVQILRLDISGLAGLYCYFVLLSHPWMEDNALAIWLIPSEFMDVNYGSTVRRYLTDHVTLLHLHRFCPTDAQFTDALVSSTVVVFRKSTPPRDHSARFSFGGPIDQPETEALVPLETLRQSDKWTQFPANLDIAKSNDLKLGDLFRIKRGIATGSNNFFIMTHPDANHWEIPKQFLKPILPNPRNLKSDVVNSLPDGTPDVEKPLSLIDCSLSEETVKSNWPRFYQYLERGIEQGIDHAYLASHRKPWYSQESRSPAPFLCTYMGRSRNGKHPFRFIWNRSAATAHNVYLLLYPVGALSDMLKTYPERAFQIFERLQSIPPEQFISEGRVYGGGLHKVEPKELAKVPAAFLLEGFESDLRKGHQMRMLL